MVAAAVSGGAAGHFVADNVDWHIVQLALHDDGKLILISSTTGERLKTYENLSVSPSGKRLIAHAWKIEEGSTEFEIFRVEGARLFSELSTSQFPVRVLSQLKDKIVDVIGWESDDTLKFYLNAFEPARLVLRDGNWQLEYLSP